MGIEAHEDELLDKYLDSQDFDVSDCCGEAVLPDTDICQGCNGHCDIISVGDYNFNKQQEAFEEKE